MTVRDRKLSTMLAGVLSISFLVGQGQAAVDLPSDARTSDGVMAVQGYVYGRPPSTDSMRIYDVERNTSVVLKLTKLHQSDFRDMGNGDFAVCAEFKSDDDKDYMLWFVVGPKEKPSIYLSHGVPFEVPVVDRTVVKTVLIHKVDGVERYIWHEEDGISKVGPAEHKHQH